jgi:hypothetical protein
MQILTSLTFELTHETLFSKCGNDWNVSKNNKIQ